MLRSSRYTHRDTMRVLTCARGMGMKGILFAAVLIALVGCSTAPVSPDLAVNAPAEHIVSHQAPISGGGAVTVVRDKGFRGSACYLGVFVNGQMAAKLSTGERVHLYLPSGRSLLASHAVGGGLCSDDRDERAEAVQIASGDSFTYRLAMSSDGIVTLTPLD
jgi:hypothetical protein